MNEDDEGPHSPKEEPSPPREYGSIANDDPNSITSNSSEAQAGVKGIEAISSTWSTWSLTMAYIGIFLVACSYSLEGQTTTGLSVYALSSFSEHSLISTVYVVQNVVNAVVKPPMAKISNVFGRLEAFSISILLYVLGYIQSAAATNVQAFASAQIFYSAGFTGLLISQQIFIADTSDLTWRVLFSALPDVPFLFTVWVGPLIAQQLYLNWRWGYGLWAIVLPTCFLPLALALFLNIRKAGKLGILPPRPWAGRKVLPALRDVALEMDLFGLILLSAAISLILIPLTLGASAGWANPSIIAMLVVGCVSLVLFLVCEAFPKVAPQPFLSFPIIRRRNVALGCIAGFFYYAAFYTSVYPYYNSYLQVVQNQSVAAAGHITLTFSFASTCAAVASGILIKLTKFYKPWILLGAAVYVLGIGLMIRYRSQDSTTAQQVGIQIAVGIGGGLWNVPMQLAVQAAVPHTSVAAATALYLTSVEIGGAVGAAIAGAVWTGSLPGNLVTYLPEGQKDLAESIFGNLTLATSYAPGSPTRLAIDQAYQATMNTMLIVAVCLAAPVFLLSLGIKGVKVDTVDQRVKGRVIGSARPVADGTPQQSAE